MRSLKSTISVLILIFINFLFCYKYLSRYSDFSYYITGILLIAQFISYWFGKKLNITDKLHNLLCYVLISIAVGLVIIGHFAIPVESLNVDRWSVISSFLNELFEGNYPYYAQSHMNNHPGPMPVYFYIAIPFYLTGELSILSCIGYCVYIGLIRKRTTGSNTFFLIFYMLTSLFLVWEITARSNIFTFSVLILLTLYGFANLNSVRSGRFYLLAIVTGLLLSTRSIYILPYIIFFFSALINKEIKFTRLIVFLSIALISFISTFIPFLIFFREDFFIMNPFIIQASSLIPAWYSFLFILLSIVLTLFVRNKPDKLFFSGLSLFAAVLIYAVYRIIVYGMEGSIFQSYVDISYFIFCTPFFMMYLLDRDQA